ncbi:MAG: adenylyltransferase/cytidyltransferase family protein [Candidatus Thermoplasmatota archaeon]
MRGLVVGRFQPLHCGHEQLIRHAVAECDEVVVAIGSSTEPQSLRNPFSFEERAAMVNAVFPTVRVVGVPDIHDEARWVAHCLRITGPVERAYGNDAQTLSLFEEAGIPTSSPGLRERSAWQATKLRKQMASGDQAWRGQVPDGAEKLLDSWGAPQRLRVLAGKMG